MKVLVLGGSGLVGSHLLRAAAAAGHPVVGTYRRHPLPGLVPLDGADTPAMARLLAAERPDAVIHAGGWTWVDGCEDDPARAFAENAEQPAALGRLCHVAGIPFAYISTSYVFDGESGPYPESAMANPINVYSQSKWAGEQQVLAATEGAALLPRVICVYGREAQKKNFGYQVLTALREGRTLTLPADQCGNPTWAGDIGRWVIRLLELRERGVWHLGGPWPECTRPEWTERLVAAFRQAGVVPHPAFTLRTVTTAELGQKARRPLRAGMISERTGSLGFQPSDFNATVAELLTAPNPA